MQSSTMAEILRGRQAGGLARAAFSHPPGLFERLRVGGGSGKPRIKACSTQWGPILNMASRSRCVLHVDPACFIYGWKSSPLVTDDFPIKIEVVFPATKAISCCFLEKSRFFQALDRLTGGATSPLRFLVHLRHGMVSRENHEKMAGFFHGKFGG